MTKKYINKVTIPNDNTDDIHDIKRQLLHEIIDRIYEDDIKAESHGDIPFINFSTTYLDKDHHVWVASINVAYSYDANKIKLADKVLKIISEYNENPMGYN